MNLHEKLMSSMPHRRQALDEKRLTADCGDITGQRCGQAYDGQMTYQPISSPGAFGLSELRSRKDR